LTSKYERRIMKKIFLALMVVVSIQLNGQSEHNLVPNPSFEEVDGKIKEGGKVTLAQPWRAINMNQVDLYSAESKSEEYSVPTNKYGEEKARTGSNYAGVSFYGYRGRMPRTYLGTRLTNPLTEGREYCMKFFVSLADRSKYAANNLAMYVTADSIVEASEKNLSFDAQIKSITNKPYEQQFLWTPICRKYTAKGGEQFIIIGNFNTDEETQLETLRLSREFSGRQSYDSYYFIDDVSVIPIDVMSEECMCDKIAGGAMEVEFKKFGTDEKEAAKATTSYIVNSDGSRVEKTEAAAAAAGGAAAAATSSKAYPESEEIMFNSTKFVPSSTESEKLDKLADYLKANPKVKLKIIGHADPSEESVPFIGKRRAFSIQKEMTKRGIDKTRVPYEGKETENLKSTSDPSQNQRVSFELMQ